MIDMGDMKEMTAREMIPAVGRKVLVTFESVEVLCNVMDVKTSWNRVRVLVQPASGTGSQWVELQRVRLALPEWLREWQAAAYPNRKPELSA